MNQIPKTESNTVEFKEVITHHLEREVIGFLNSQKGGDIYIGVTNEGKVIGVENPDSLQLVITDRIKNNILPTVLGAFDVFTEEIQGKTIIHIVISRGVEKLYYLKKYGLSPRGAFIRIGSSVQQMTSSMIEEQFAMRTRNSLRNIRSPRVGSHTFSQLKIYYQEKGFSINDAFLNNLDFYTPNEELNYIAYLFADINSISMKVAKYSGKDKIDLIENEEYGYCSLIKATNLILDKLEIENRTFTKITGAAERLQKRMIDRTALREALINAIVHNDYSREVTPVVEIYADRLTITSYGGLVEGLSKEEFFKGRSMLRNREVMRIFKDLELVEQLGSGMTRILDKYSKDIFNFSQHFIEVVFPFEQDYFASKEFEEQAVIKSTPQVTTQVKELVLVIRNEHKRNELQKLLKLSNREYFRKAYLLAALDLELVEMTQPDAPNSPTQKYRLTAKGQELKKQLED